MPVKKSDKKVIKKNRSPVKKLKHLPLIVETKIFEEGYDSYFTLKIVANSEELAKEAKKYYLTHNREEDFTTAFAGLVIPPIQMGEQMDAEGNTSINFAICYLSAEDLCYSIIAHECVHIALLNERILKRYVGGYPDQNAKFGYCHEERLCYLVEEYVEKIINFCKSKKIRINNN